MPLKSALLLETQSAVESRLLREKVENLVIDNEVLQESLSQVQQMFAREDRGWSAKFASADEFGMSLDELKEWSEQIRNAAIGAPWIKRGLGLRSSYIWQGGIYYGNIPGKKQGTGVNVQAIIDHPINQRNFYSAAARTRREGCLYSDGLYLTIGDNVTKVLHNIPLQEITADLRDPDHQEDVWAYRREWQRYNSKTKQSDTIKRWYYTDTFYDKRPTAVGGKAPFIEGSDGEREYISQNHTAFDMVANGMDGFAYGSPDALAALIWSRIARDAYMDGIQITSALATFAFKASVATKAGADGASMKVASAPAGSTAVVGQTNDLVPMSSAGKAYQFDDLRGVVAVVATALSVSAIALTSDPGAAGSSYGSASTLDLPTRLAMEARREEHKAYDRRILIWSGAKDAEVYFQALTDPTDMYRQTQGVILEWDTGLYSPEEIKTALEALKGNDISKVKVPDGVMLPNNEKYTASLTNDGADPAATAGTSKTGSSQGSAGTGVSAGSAPNNNAGRTDTLAK